MVKFFVDFPFTGLTIMFYLNLVKGLYTLEGDLSLSNWLRKSCVVFQIKFPSKSNVVQTPNITDLQDITPTNISTTVSYLVRRCASFQKVTAQPFLLKMLLHSNSFMKFAHF